MSSREAASALARARDAVAAGWRIGCDANDCAAFSDTAVRPFGVCPGPHRSLFEENWSQRHPPHHSRDGWARV